MTVASPSGDTRLTSGVVTSVNVGKIREVEFNGRTVTTGIFKSPTLEPQRVAGVHIGDDQQADTAAHGGPDKSVYAYSAEDYAWWEEQLGRTLDPGTFGENLQTSGIDISHAKVGDRWRIGSVVLEVSEPRMPCYKLSIAVGQPRFQQTFAQADRPGAYFRVVSEGELVVGDAIEVEPTTDESITLAEINVIYHREHERAAALLDVPGLSSAWHRWARDVSGG